MNDNARKWVDALRSGDYVQGDGRLTTLVLEDGKVVEEKDCCLGVACKLFVEENPEALTCVERYLDRDSEVLPARRMYGEAEYTLPEEVQKWLDLNSEDGTYGLNGSHRALTADNDAGYPLAEIADIIEQHDELFTGAANG